MRKPRVSASFTRDEVRLLVSVFRTASAGNPIDSIVRKGGWGKLYSRFVNLERRADDLAVQYAEYKKSLEREEANKQRRIAEIMSVIAAEAQNRGISMYSLVQKAGLPRILHTMHRGYMPARTSLDDLSRYLGIDPHSLTGCGE